MLRKYYGDCSIEKFGPTAIKTLRSEFINLNWARSTINKQIFRIIRMFRWGVSESLVKPEVLTALESVPGLKAGRSQAREPEPIRPVSESDVEAIRPFVSPVVMAMIDIQRLTGMRPAEVCKLRTVDIIHTDDIWEYRPQQHKTIHHGKKRFVFFGPLAQQVLKLWLRPDEPDAYLFSPEMAVAIKKSNLRKVRKTNVQPSQANRAKSEPKRKPRLLYSTRSYNRAITYAVKRAGINNWHPNQLRHLAATNLRREFGIETARAILGHSTVSMTEIYAEMDAAKARDAMAKSG
jgi:integrase